MRRFAAILVGVALVLGASAPAPAQAPAGGAPITLDVRDADVRDLLDALASNHGLNVVYGPDTHARISIHLEKVSLDAAIDAIVRAGALTSFRRGGILYVVKSGGSEGPIQDTRIFALRWADLEQTAGMVKAVLGENGKVTTYEYGRTLVVWDEPARLDLVEQLVAAVDQAPRQVLIEARILEVKLTDDLKLGINWSEVLNTGKLTGRMDQSGFAQPPGPGREGFFATLRRGDLQMLLQTLQQQTAVNTLASPKVLGLDNREAQIIIGGRLGYPVATSTATATIQSIQFIEVGTQLKLVPHVVGDGSVLMEVHPEVSDGEVVNGLPRENTTEATTTVLVPGGQTLLLGGLLREKTSKLQVGVPLLCRVPVLRWLFGRTVQTTEKTEIAVLITPQVLEPGQVPATP